MADLTTLANAKQWLGITTTDSDSLLTRLISASSDYIQTWLNRQIALQSYTETRDGTGGNRLMFANYPATGVTSLYIDGLLIPPSSGPGVDGWVADQFKVSLRGRYAFSRDVQNVTITYTAGFATTPTEIEQACVELVSRRFKDKDRIGITSKGLAGETISFSQVDFSDAIENTLKNYKKVISL